MDKETLKKLMGEKPPEKRKNKYNNKQIKVNGILYHSKNEYARECILRTQQKAGIIKDLKRQIEFSLDVDGVHICNYVADWSYTVTKGNIPVVEDFKGVITDVFRIKSNLMKACHGIEVWANKKINAHCDLQRPQ